MILVLPPVVQVPGVVNGSLLATLISSVEEELEGTEWATRKAAADTLACLATALGPALSTAKASCTAALVTCRFDKVFLKSSSSSIHFSFSPSLFPSFGFLSLDWYSSVTTDLEKSTFLVLFVYMFHCGMIEVHVVGNYSDFDMLLWG
jgi:hypothetical protein